MATTIQISNELKDLLQKRKLNKRDTFEDVIFDLLEDTMELSEQTKKNIEEAKKNIREGKVHKWEDVKKELGLNV
jgi:serine/threonine protein kinase HipA of HipAB toxin-antitoxin module